MNFVLNFFLKRSIFLQCNALWVPHFVIHTLLWRCLAPKCLTHGCLDIVRDPSVGHVSLEDALIQDALLVNAEAESLPWPVCLVQIRLKKRDQSIPVFIQFLFW